MQAPTKQPLYTHTIQVFCLGTVNSFIFVRGIQNWYIDYVDDFLIFFFMIWEIFAKVTVKLTVEL